jgi:hypothetical protein
MSAGNGNGETPAAAEVVRRPVDRTPLSRRDPVALAKHFFDSGFFPDLNSMSQAVVKIVAGEELGLGPMTSMQGFHIIKGKPAMSANLLGVKAKQSGRYNFRPVEVDDKHAKIAWFENGKAVGHTEFTIEQAKKAKLIAKDSGWEKYPEDLLFARALSRGVRRFCPEVTAGVPAYTPEELGAEVDQQGEPVHVEATVQPVVDKLPPERIELLSEKWQAVRPIFEADERNVNALDGLNVMLGSLGIDGFAPIRGGVAAGFEGLSPEQADQVEEALQAILDEEAEKQPADSEAAK